MKLFFSPFLLIALAGGNFLCAQSLTVDKRQFFTDTSILQATITTNMGKLFNRRDKIGYQFPATFAANVTDSMVIKDKIILQVRGHFRRSYCYVPPLKVIFKLTSASYMGSMHALKLVNECKVSKIYDQYLIR